MHAHLDITPEQHEKLEPIEQEFEKQRTRLKEEIRTAGLEVAAAITPVPGGTGPMTVTMLMKNTGMESTFSILKYSRLPR